MLLPGGVLRNGEIDRRFAFRPVTGALEVALAEAAGAPNRPAAVTAVLAGALAELGGEPVTLERVRELAVGDRQYLARCLTAHLGRGERWLTATCTACAEQFDFSVHLSELAVKESEPGFPYAEIEVEGQSLRLRTPTGADQEAIAAFADTLDEELSTRALLARCVVDAPPPRGWSEESIARAEAALERIAPEVAVAVLAACPACGHENEIEIDPYLGLESDGDVLYDEIHALAATYHWSEAEILALPQDRRQRYLTLIDRARGIAQ